MWASHLGSNKYPIAYVNTLTFQGIEEAQLACCGLCEALPGGLGIRPSAKLYEKRNFSLKRHNGLFFT